MKFSQNKKTIFLDPHSDIVVSDENLDIILSPSLYWVKKLALPVKYVHEARKFLESLFEDILPEGNYNYHVYKDENKSESFYIFAYEDKVILDLLHTHKLSLSKVSSVHFAQSELSSIEGAIKINETQSIYVKDSIVTLVPCCWIEESGDLDLSDFKLSKHKITLQQFSHIVDNSSLNKIWSILVVFIILILSESYILNQKIQTIETQTSELFVKYKLKPTMFQNKALLKKYKSIHTTQIKFRIDMKNALKKTGTKKITYKNKLLKVGS